MRYVLSSNRTTPDGGDSFGTACAKHPRFWESGLNPNRDTPSRLPPLDRGLHQAHPV
ncbi:hypothetical protein AURDEDRAFT_115678 [Auricularia subglabra TFB-10046 SS5]|uniref:Uncharacterized protein n=1 Tax=Auricularia subglabra (strain TFB-10046 / SS5) TaxID=717982 RepID=J0DD29_AURST|nr:hypothetical protein AURDEDRAFT_115678 [Auricularia subglabra TFB-10046 SS5]